MPGHKHNNSVAQNQKAQLATAYNELGRELSSSKIKVVGNYTLGKVIGEGTYGKVRLGTHRLTSTRVAIKQIPKAMSATLTREIHHHRQLHHPHVTQLFEVIATESCIWLVTELCSGGELFDYLSEKARLSEHEARHLFGQLCLAVNYVHDKGIVHRDLKLENVLLDERCRVKLGDFGFTREFERGGFLETYCGTTGYASPEMLEGKKYTGPEVDVWSLGVILYCLLTGGLPFDDDDEVVMRAKVIKADFADPEFLSDDARDLLRKVLQKDPMKRATIAQMLAHPWFHPTPSLSVAVPASAPAAPPLEPQPSQDTSESSVGSESTFCSASSDLDGTSATTPDEEFSHESAFEEPHIHRNPSEATIRRDAKKVVQPETVPEEDAPSPSPSRRPSLSRGTTSSASPRLSPSLPTRTPVRTKRRSVSSTLSDPASPDKTTAQFPPQDFSSLLSTPAPIIFSTPLERELLNSLSALGLDTGQIVHSVLSNACDSASAIWWMLKRKAERRALEEIESKAALVTVRSPDDPESRGSVEKKRSKPRMHDPNETPQASRGMPAPLSATHSAPELALIPPTPVAPSHQRPTTPPNPNRPFLSPSPSNTNESAVKSNPSTPGSSIKEKDGSKGRHEGKMRSGSVSIMQRATTALEAAGLVRKKSAEGIKDSRDSHSEKRPHTASEDTRSSHTGSGRTKSPPLKASKEAVAMPEFELGSTTSTVPSSPWVMAGVADSPPREALPSPTLSHDDTLTALPVISGSGIKSGHQRHRGSLLSTFRMWFNEDRKGKRKAGSSSGMPSSSYGHKQPATPSGRRASNSRQNRRAKRASMSSHRSSSVNSRRSSNASMHPLHESPQFGLDHVPRRGEPSRRSFGSRTPNSEAGEFFSSRPSSVHSFVKARHRKSPSASSAGSIVRTASPYHRRGGSGSSTRVVRSPTQQTPKRRHVRSNSTASSIHSLTSSRPGSFYEPSDGELTRAASPYKAHSLQTLEEAPRRGATTFVAQKRQTPFLPPSIGHGASLSRSSWKKSWGLEPPGWQTRTAHLPVEVLAILPATEGPASIRDVFTGRQSLSPSDEDDWVDEEEEGPAYAGGLGQLPASTHPQPQIDTTFGGYPVEMLNSPAPRAGGIGPRLSAPSSSSGKRATGKASNPPGSRGSKAAQSPVGRISPLPNDIMLDPAPEPRGGRRQLPNARAGPFRQHAIAIQEEEEEEEE
ncbi:hypothetical protein OF83DRAFT_1119942 [Amylostereum chailletii]|nr:hypothetical protein OF83DRAFT_1119942 [Amylostereum chailletii]